MALSNPFNPPPNTQIVKQDAVSDSIWRRWFEQLWKRVQTGSLGGTVTSVGLSMPTDVFDVTNSPVTSSGTLTVAFDDQTNNTVFAGPATAPADTPAFRALVAADLPAGTGDVVGPASSSDNAIVRFNGTTGKLVQNSTPTIADTGVLTAPTGLVVGTTSGVLQMPDGTVSAPGLRVGTSSVTGLFSSADNSVRVACVGSQIASFTTSGLDLAIALAPTEGGTGLTSPGTSGNVLTSNGSSWVSSAPTGAENLLIIYNNEDLDIATNTQVLGFVSLTFSGTGNLNIAGTGQLRIL